jgi:tetratricopeptide (TPR) repeat protein
MKPQLSRFLTRWVTCLALVASPFVASASEQDCGPLRNHFGPFDYRSASPQDRALVEGAHFTPQVESLKGGKNTITAGGDINYTLMVFPNHHRALMATIKLSEKEKTDKPRGMGYTVACWFDRAERFRPDDGTVKMLHGIYLIRKGKAQAAADKLEQASELAGDNANITYNLGLAYFDLKQYDKSLASAHAAYALGFPLPGLRDKLKRAGKWSEAIPVAVNQPKMPEIPAKREDSGGYQPSVPTTQSPEPASATSSPAN